MGKFDFSFAPQHPGRHGQALEAKRLDYKKSGMELRS
jgi:hypothetical protein